MADLFERLIADEARPGIEFIELGGGPGYEDERLILQNGLGNGLRFLMQDEDTELAHFHINSPETALLIAERLTAWAARIADPPEPR
jgi:hypothetical protein